jgi:hypothetical protein
MPEQVSCDLSGEAVVLNMKSGMYYGMGDVGALIWGSLDQPRTFADLRELILQEYEVAAEACEQDLIAFLTELESAGLVEITNGKAA